MMRLSVRPSSRLPNQPPSKPHPPRTCERCQRRRLTQPAPSSKTAPESGTDSWARKATTGATYSGLSASTRSGGMMLAVMREPAMGAITFT
jgi:hypothetical protein